ncbi:TfuA-like protein [Ruegeria arenilitoris]|uniref:TfuA-like protein n=1 Tax=Ruegeria arenilitoris TaxID=1173585 RepID=UPI00147D22D9|nr:TfuA-like protein [Ruegeria arenilitoris]
MTAVVFVGPTLAPEAVSDRLDATILPPVRQGDVYRVVRDKPTAIGIIDGFFEGVPSVWHKEILWAIEQGIPVFGSASMGALRAAELADFGMIGVGGIFEDYSNGTLQDDDEVAVLHSPAELGFQSLSEPMVSIRATVAQAETAGVLSPDTASEVLRCAKAMHYRHRTWPDILGALQNLSGITEFANWLPTGRIDAKARDAVAMLECMAEYLTGTPLPPSDIARTEPTLMWKALRARVDAGDPSADRSVVDELRLQPELYTTLRNRAVLALLSREEASRQDRPPERAELVRQMEDHRATIGLSRRSDLMAWIEANDLSPEGYETMLADAARIEAATASRASRLDAQLLSELRRSDQYTQLRDRAASKAEQALPAGQSGVDRLRVLMWYFESRLDQPVPDDLDSYAVALGLSGRDAFYEMIEAEFLYCHRGADTGAAE